jgi:uncharacterized protein YbjT (DUF2867 family)
MFVIAGVTGHVGSVVASTLLERGKKVRVIVRDAHKGEAWQRRGAEVAVADLTDARALAAALGGAEGVFALVPPDYVSEDPLAAQAHIVDAWAQAVTAAKPAHLVLLSSIGAELPSGSGPILTVHRAEEKLRGATKLTAVRPTYFMENWLRLAQPVQSDGVLPSMLTAGRAVPMVATADIGRVAAAALLDGDRAPAVIELAGPRDYTPEEVAAAFAGALGRSVNVVPVPDAQIEPALIGGGLKPKMAALYREMNGSFNNGRIHFHSAPTRGTIGIEDVVRAVAS